MPRRLPEKEFIALMAMLFATVAFSIDAMLPALPVIGQELSPDNPNRVQYVITIFMLGMGLGTFVTGPLADAFGRRRIIMMGLVLYAAGAILAASAISLEMVLLGRFLQGLGAAGPRVAGLAMVRDLYSGRQMARIVSFVMMVFTLLPAVAPSLGAVIIALAGWHGIFGAFLAFALMNALWLGFRQEETLRPENRRPLSLTRIWEAIREMAANRTVVVAIAAQVLALSMLMMTLTSVQQIFEQYFGRGDTFPLWFGLVALCAGMSSFFNARVVMRLGMRVMIRAILLVQMIFSAIVLTAFISGVLPPVVEFAVFLVWLISVVMVMALGMGNLNAVAMEPVGRIAGIAASVISAISTVGAVILAIPVGQLFNGTPVPLAAGIFCAATGAYLLVKTQLTGADPD
ncbi:MAG: MFS transporter [Celeribacter sp.]|jgi:DHA1 family bicyclomycin/chloramphenicol resistance-like MFS transporter